MARLRLNTFHFLPCRVILYVESGSVAPVPGPGRIRCSAYIHFRGNLTDFGELMLKFMPVLVSRIALIVAIKAEDEDDEEQEVIDLSLDSCQTVTPSS